MSGFLGGTEEISLSHTLHHLISFRILKIHVLDAVTIKSNFFLNVTLYVLVTKLQLF